jgi:putative transposase
MKRSRYTAELIIGILKERQVGLSAHDLCRKHGISNATFYKRRPKYGGVDISDARNLKALEEESGGWRSCWLNPCWTPPCSRRRSEKTLTPRARRSAVG